MDICAIDETVLIKLELLDAVIPTIRTSRRPMLILTSTASPKVSYNWFITKWQNAEQLQFERFEWSPDECHWIDKRTTARLKLLMDKATASVELEGGIVKLPAAALDLFAIVAVLVFFYPYLAGQTWIVG